MPALDLAAPAESPTCLVVLLPGIHDSPPDFADSGFADDVTARFPDARVVAADAHLGYYRKRTVLDRVRADVIAPFLAENAGEEVWVAGVSLGGLGGLLLRRHHPEEIAGVVALAPFLGEDDLVAEIAAAGGPGGWNPPEVIAPDDVGRQMWAAFREELDDAERGGEGELGEPPIHLGVGLDDDFLRADRLLAGLLPEGRTREIEGGHDWPTWRSLWRSALDAGALEGCAE